MLGFLKCRLKQFFKGFISLYCRRGDCFSIKRKKLINKRLRRGQLSLLEHFHFRLRCAVWNFTPQLCPLLALACLSIRRLGFLLGGTFPRSLLCEAARPLPSVPCMPSSSLTSRLCPKLHSPLTGPRLPAAVSASSSPQEEGVLFPAPRGCSPISPVLSLRSRPRSYLL